uniref:Uncharacterized protein n=1 Tax=Lotharella globosa TaxID=91324 RepID=A0A7S3ZAQ3_9EUKA|mmetsp:Transcript_16131/g.32694  ORF Transcript_16131/g.32694 Transcript_16131/m.32694 type:complete len:248 (+) Transcript_16131:33-776(+)
MAKILGHHRTMALWLLPLASVALPTRSHGSLRISVPASRTISRISTGVQRGLQCGATRQGTRGQTRRAFNRASISSLASILLLQKSALADAGDNLPEPIKKTFIKRVPKKVLDARRLRKLEDAVQTFDGLDDLLELEQYEDAKKLLRDPKVKYLRGNLRESNTDFLCTSNDDQVCIVEDAGNTLIGKIESFDQRLKVAIVDPANAPNDSLRDQAEDICVSLKRIVDVVRERTPKDVPEEFIGSSSPQ